MQLSTRLTQRPCAFHPLPILPHFPGFVHLSGSASPSAPPLPCNQPAITTIKLHPRRALRGGTSTSAAAVAMAIPAPPVAPFPMPTDPLLGAFIGGLLLGTAVVGNLLLNGRVLGVSGTIKGLLQGDSQGWRPAFLLGLLLPVPFLATLFPAALIALPASMTVGRSLVSGLLVGLGAALGNGCTSGHGICGNARLSVRSLAFTSTFMVAGAISVRLFSSVAALGVPPIAPALPPRTCGEMCMGIQLLGASVVVLLLMGVVLKAVRGRQQGGWPDWASQAAQLVTSALVGAVFASGLMLSRMTNPHKVVSFLSILTPAWDPALIFVMIGAILASIVPYQMVMGHLGKVPQPLVSPVLTNTYALPSNKAPVDLKLIVGGALFGLGWGMSGMCPGPALLAAVAPATAGQQVWAYLGGMVAGMAAEQVVSKVLAGGTPTPSPAGPAKA